MFIEKLLMFLVIVSLASCSNNPKSKTLEICPAIEGDGIAKETAVNGLFNHPYTWLQEKHPGHERGMQALTRDGYGNKYDIITVKTKDGKKSYWFSYPNEKCLKIMKKILQRSEIDHE